VSQAAVDYTSLRWQRFGLEVRRRNRAARRSACRHEIPMVYAQRLLCGGCGSTIQELEQEGELRGVSWFDGEPRPKGGKK
jgi:hypothetical protein